MIRGLDRAGVVMLLLVSITTPILASCSSNGDSARTAVQIQAMVEEAQRQRDIGEVDAAEATLRNAVEMSPDNAVARYSLAILQRDRNDWLAAAENFREFVVLRPELPGAHIELVKALRNGGERTEAVAVGRAALELFPDNATLRYVVGRILVTLGDVDAGDRLVMSALRIDPSLEGTNP